MVKNGFHYRGLGRGYNGSKIEYLHQAVTDLA
jgi:hypothetical protein